MRPRVPLTGRGWAVLVTGVAAYVVGIWAGYPVFRILAGMALGAVLAATALTVRRPRIEVRRELYPTRVERGKPALVTLRLRNVGQRWHRGFAAFDPSTHDLAGYAREQVEIRRLAPGAETSCRYELFTSRRGRVTVGPLVLELSDPLRLARRRVPTGDSAVLRVQPKRHPARTVLGGRPRHHHESRTTDTSLRGSTDLRDVRAYVVGDEVRHVHWKATARLGQLMVRDYVDPDQPRIGVLLDTRSGVLTAAGFEEAVEFAASVAFSAAMAGHRCRLLASNGLDLVAAGPVAARRVLDSLTEIRQADTTGRSDTSDQEDPDRSDGSEQHAMPLLPSSMFSSPADGGTLVLVTGPHLTARELAPATAHYRSVTAVSIGTTADLSGLAGVSTPRVRWIGATRAADAIRQWNLED